MEDRKEVIRVVEGKTGKEGREAKEGENFTKKGVLHNNLSSHRLSH